MNFYYYICCNKYQICYVRQHIHTDRYRALQQDCSQNKNSTPEAEHVAGRAGRQERCLHLHHKTHGGRRGKELRVADPRPAHPGQARHLHPACRGGAVEPE